jgi:glycosyltransferase involved in cell wall biosynthesis/tetratricopeptide (TPR) repeat protein
MSTARQTPQRTLVSFATGWGSEFGGINVFNSEFLQHFAFATQGNVKVVCVVPAATPKKIERALEQGVTLVPLPYTPAELKLDSSHSRPVIEKLNELGLAGGEQEIVWLGHDRITGAVALEAKELTGGRVAMIHHMSYTHYEAYAESASSANAKSEIQRTLFAQADVLFAVGPLLRDALQDMLPAREIITLVPGLEELPIRPAPRTFTGFMSGRLSADAAKIKQGHLGVAAFADAYKRAYSESGLPDALKNQPRLILRGADMESQTHLDGYPDTTDWRRFAEAYADRVVNIQALSYTTERNELLDELSRATVALMPSWHEGFGLAGWEAVAAGVPLVVSENSGLYQLLREHRNGAWLNWVYAVDIRGRVDEPYFHPEDLKGVSDKLLEIAKNPAASREKAVSLREGAFSDFPWRHCVQTALGGLHWLIAERQNQLISVPAALPVSENNVLTGGGKETPLEIPGPRWQIGSGLADSQLLRAEEAAVPFDSAREPEAIELVNWANDSEYTEALRLITGPGGTGKTRLALELCKRLTNDGWHCGFLPSDIGVAQATGAWAVLAGRREPILVVFDYAETRQDTLLAFLKAMLQARAKHRLRLLLLARDGSEWWDRLPARDAGCEPFLSGYATSGPFGLPLLHDSLPSRERAYEAAVDAYASRLGIIEHPHLKVDLSGEHFGRPLYVQMAALLALHGERPASAEGLTKALLHHERRYWQRLLAGSSVTAPILGVDDRHASELMTLATLSGGFPRAKDAEQAWASWRDAVGNELDTARQRSLFEQLAPLYPGQQGLQPLRPDLLGEALVAQALLHPSGKSLLSALWGSSSQATRRRHAFTIVARLSNHRIDIEATVVKSLVETFPACAKDLVLVATQSDSRLPEWAERAFSLLSKPIQHQVAGLLLPITRYESVQLGELACAVSNSELDKHRVKLERRLNDSLARVDYAVALSNHSVNLARAGHDHEAIEVSQQSVTLMEQVVGKKAGAFDRQWASILRNHSGRLAFAGRYTDALVCSEKALRIYERLAHMDAKRYEPEYATSLRDFAASLSDEARDTEALETAGNAVKIHERLARIDQAKYGYEWARSLSTYATILSQNGLYGNALAVGEKAREIYEELATTNADRFEPEWADALDAYAVYLSFNERPSEALQRSDEALAIRSRLARKNPTRFEPDLSISLTNYGLRLSALGRYSEALACAEAALEIDEKLVQANPDAFRPNLAISLMNYANHLMDIGHYADALPVSERAVEITELCIVEHPRRFAEDLITRLLLVIWIKWMIGDLPSLISVPGIAQEELIVPRRIPVIGTYQAWVKACIAGTTATRITPFSEVLRLSSEIALPEARDVEMFSLCAAAWFAHHYPDDASSAPFRTDWEFRWRHFMKQCRQPPRWMEDVARRMDFTWPELRDAE